jgi:hypothetical protein
MDEIALEPADSLHGQLQRGRGLGARRALSHAGVAELSMTVFFGIRAGITSASSAPSTLGG